MNAIVKAVPFTGDYGERFRGEVSYRGLLFYAAGVYECNQDALRAASELRDEVLVFCTDAYVKAEWERANRRTVTNSTRYVGSVLL